MILLLVENVPKVLDRYLRRLIVLKQVVLFLFLNRRLRSLKRLLLDLVSRRNLVQNLVLLSVDMVSVGVQRSASVLGVGSANVRHALLFGDHLSTFLELTVLDV